MEQLHIPTFPDDIPFPRHTRSADEWDRYWLAILPIETSDPHDALRREARTSLLQYRFLHAVQYGPYVETFRYLGIERLLFAGNGIRVLPDLFRPAGFQLDVVDISGVASRYRLDHPPTDKQYDQFLSQSAAGPPGDLMQGSITYRTEDLLSAADPAEPYGAIFAQNLVEHFRDSERAELIERFHRWLAPGGILLVETIHHTRTDLPVGDESWYAGQKRRVGDLETTFEEAGFTYHLRDAWAWYRAAYMELLASHPHTPMHHLYPDQALEEEFQRRKDEARADDLARLKRGARIVVFTSPA